MFSACVSVKFNFCVSILQYFTRLLQFFIQLVILRDCKVSRLLRKGWWCGIRNAPILRAHSFDVAVCASLWKAYAIGTLKHHSL